MASGSSGVFGVHGRVSVAWGSNDPIEQSYVGMVPGGAVADGCCGALLLYASGVAGVIGMEDPGEFVDGGDRVNREHI